MLNHPGVGLGEEGGKGRPMILNEEAGTDPPIKVSDNDGPQARLTWLSRRIIIPTSKKTINTGPTHAIPQQQRPQNKSLIEASRPIPQEKDGLEKLQWPPPGNIYRRRSRKLANGRFE
eukprot:755214-Hanusia_phi.AAC.2